MAPKTRINYKFRFVRIHNQFFLFVLVCLLSAAWEVLVHEHSMVNKHSLSSKQTAGAPRVGWLSVNISVHLPSCIHILNSTVVYTIEDCNQGFKSMFLSVRLIVDVLILSMISKLTIRSANIFSVQRPLHKGALLQVVAIK